MSTLPDPLPAFSWAALSAMVLALLASVGMYVMLVRRWTSRRQWVSLSRWGRESGFRLRPARQQALPKPLDQVIPSDAVVRFHLGDERTTLVQFEVADASQAVPRPRINLLIRSRPTSGPAAGLRPTSAKVCLIDLLPLSQYASMTLGERFVIYATDHGTARRLAESAVLTLVPKDVGLVLLDGLVVLDFSARPFDPIEFGRMIALSEQLAGVVS